jgi:hypothetical protein
MKFHNKSKTYKASNVSFDAVRVKAYSYDWWVFVDVIGGKVVFNSYNYSNSTCKHQYKVRRLMRELDIKIDLEIEVPRGLQDLSSAVEYYTNEIQNLKAQIEKPRSQKAKNLERQVQIGENAQKILDVKNLIQIQNKRGT